MPVRTDFYQRLTIEGGGLEKFNNLGTERMILSASISLTVEQASEVSFQLLDPNWGYVGSFAGDRGPIGKKAMYGSEMPLYVSSFSLDGGPAGTGGSTLKMQPAGIERARLITGALNRGNISPTDYAKDAAAHCGMKFVGEPSPVRPSVTRDVGTDDNKNADANEWSTIKRLAAEEGFLAFECLNTLYFASPKWLFDKQPVVTVGYGGTVLDRHLQIQNTPSIDMSTSKNTDDEVSFDLPIEAAGRIMPGMNIIVKGIFRGMADKKLLVTSIGYPLAGLGSVSVSAKYPWTIEKQALAGEGGGNSGSGGGSFGTLAGNTDGERAANACLSQRGVTYAWGGGGYNGPTKGIRDGGVADQHGDFNKVGFDCSGLMQYGWYQGSKGRVKLPRVTYSQRQAGPQISLGQLVPGDLIMMSGDGHVGMFVGGGKMVEAPQSGDVVKVSNLRGGYGVQIR